MMITNLSYHKKKYLFPRKFLRLTINSVLMYQAHVVVIILVQMRCTGKQEKLT